MQPTTKPLLIIILLVSLLGSGTLYAVDQVKVRSFDHRNFTRLVLESEDIFPHRITENRRSLLITVDGRIDRVDTSGVQDDSVIVERVSVRRRSQRTLFQISTSIDYELSNQFVLENPHRVVIDLVKKNPSPEPAPPQSESPREPVEDDGIPQTPENRESTDPRSRGKEFTLQTICIDPGHGGNDIGAEGQSGLLEKDITLEIARKLRNIIISRRGIEAVLTRNGDEEISLNQRAAIANNNRADLFLSIHVNGSYRRSVRGPEIYFASLKATDSRSYDLARRENINTGSDNAQNGDTLNMILWNMAQTQYIKESSILAEAVQEELNVLLDTVNRGVKQAPFRVLMRANMPSILIEVAFVTNPSEEKMLSRDSFLNQVAAAIYRGIEKYIDYHKRGYRP